jgi:hypothetical protein
MAGAPGLFSPVPSAQAGIAGSYSHVPITAVIFALAAFVAYGRGFSGASA